MADDPRTAKLRLELENGRLKLEKENATLRAEIGALTAPWWRSARSVAALTALIAAIVPITTAVHGYFQKEREIALEEAKQAEQVRVSYLDKVRDGTSTFRTLRFIQATTTDPGMKSWATQEIKRLEEELVQWNEQARKQAAIVESLEKAYATEVAKESPDPAPTAAEVVRRKEALDRARTRLEQISNRYGQQQRSCDCDPLDTLCSCL